MYKILVIDDDPSGTELLITLLGLEGFQGSRLENWADPLADVERQRPDLVIMDVYLSDRDGVELLRDIRAHSEPRIANTPVLMMSAENLERGLYQLDVLDPQGMKERLEKKSMGNFLDVIRKSVERSGYKERDISYVGMLHMKRSAHDYVLRELGLKDTNSIYLEDYGHIGQIDQFLSLELAEKSGKLKDGDIAVLVSAGIGYAWGATTIRWGKGEL